MQTVMPNLNTGTRTEKRQARILTDVAEPPPGNTHSLNYWDKAAYDCAAADLTPGLSKPISTKVPQPYPRGVGECRFQPA